MFSSTLVVARELIPKVAFSSALTGITGYINNWVIMHAVVVKAHILFNNLFFLI